MKHILFPALSMMALSLSVQAKEKNEERLDVYPILKPYSWNAKPHVVFTPFLGIDQNPIPIVSYGFEQPDSYQFLTRQEASKPADVIHQQAIDNLCKTNINLDNVTKDGSFAVTGSGHPFSAEMILCPEFLKKAHTTLQDETIVIAIPRRTVIYIGKGSMTEEERKTFYFLARHAYLDDSFGNAPITNVAFTFNNGQATSITQYSD